MQRRKSVGLRTRSGILIFAFVASSSGCMVKGFTQIPDGLTTPTQLRSGAAIARAEAVALDAIAAEQQGVIDRTVGMIREASDSIGAPAAITGLMGAAAGWMVPTPGSKRREKLAKAEGAAGRGLPPA